MLQILRRTRRRAERPLFFNQNISGCSRTKILNIVWSSSNLSKPAPSTPQHECAASASVRNMLSCSNQIVPISTAGQNYLWPAGTRPNYFFIPLGWSKTSLWFSVNSATDLAICSFNVDGMECKMSSCTLHWSEGGDTIGSMISSPGTDPFFVDAINAKPSIAIAHSPEIWDWSLSPDTLEGTAGRRFQLLAWDFFLLVL